MGPFIMGPGTLALPQMSTNMMENRQNLIDFCKFNGYILSGTFIDKPASQQCTYKFATTNGFVGPWTPDRFAQIDHLICPQRWRNSIKNVESRTDIAVDSDHAMIIARVKIKLKNDKTLRRHTINRSREPTEALKTQFNDRIREIYSFISGSKGIEVNNTRFTHAISKATKECLIKIPFEQKTSYISEETWQLIQRRQEARNNGQTQVEKHLTLCVQRQAKLDKKKWRLDRLEDWKTPKSKWAGIKFEKKVFTPIHTIFLQDERHPRKASDT